MKSTVAVALVASFVPFVLASPYHMVKHAERDSVQYEVDYVTDVQVATVYEQVTQYWTGEPAATETVTYSAPETTSAAQTTESAHQRQHGAHSHSSSVEYTIEKTTTPEAAPTTTSTVVAPVPTTTSTVAPAPEPTTTSVVVVAPTLPTVVIATAQAPVFTVAALPTTTSSTSVETPVVASQAIAMDSADWIATPSYAVAGYAATGDAAWDTDNMKAAVVQSHNAWRAKWGADPLVWDDEQASEAQDSANTCVFAHTRNVGQNIAGGDGDYSPTNAVNSWGEESVDWRDSNRVGGSAPSTWDSKGKEVTHSPLHFTQVNWKATTKVGCGVRQCGTMGWYIVCNYDPVGNMADGADHSYVDPTNTTRTGSYAKYVNNAPLY